MTEVEAFGLRYAVADLGALGLGEHAGAYTDHEPVLGAWCSALRLGATVVDAGACFGAYALPALAAGARVVAYEPWPPGLRALRACLAANPGFTERCCVREVALWDDTPMSEALARRVWGHHYPMEGGVSATTLDVDLSALGISRIDALKLDVEGAELHVLLGAARTLERCRPALFVEDHAGVSPDPQCVVSRYAESIDSSRRIHEMLEDLGYAVEVVRWDVSRRFIVARHPAGPGSR